MDSTALLKQAFDLYQQGEVNQAIKIWQSIQREDSPKNYAKAQFNLGNTLREQGDIKGEIEAYRNVQREDAPETYAKAQFYLGTRLKGRLKLIVMYKEKMLPKPMPKHSFI